MLSEAILLNVGGINITFEEDIIQATKIDGS
jgi:hypothetical protein